MSSSRSRPRAASWLLRIISNDRAGRFRAGSPSIRRWVACSAMAWMVVGCHNPERPPFDYLPDMRYSVPHDAFAPHPMLANQQTLRPPAAGTIARGHLPLGFGTSLAEAARAGRELSNPIPLTPEALARGRELYATFCLVCHGASGDGDGSLVPRIAAPPSYRSPQIRAYPPGRLFHVITFGRGRMAAYGTQIRRADRWRLVHHLQTLQTPDRLGDPSS